MSEEMKYFKDKDNEENVERKLNFSKITNRVAENISSEEALQDIIPIQWTEDVLLGKKKIVITKESEE